MKYLVGQLYFLKLLLCLAQDVFYLMTGQIVCLNHAFLKHELWGCALFVLVLLSMHHVGEHELLLRIRLVKTHYIVDSVSVDLPKLVHLRVSGLILNETTLGLLGILESMGLQSLQA